MQGTCPSVSQLVELQVHMKESDTHNSKGWRQPHIKVCSQRNCFNNIKSKNIVLFWITKCLRTKTCVQTPPMDKTRIMDTHFWLNQITRPIVVFYLTCKSVKWIHVLRIDINLIQLQSAWKRKLCMCALFDPLRIPQIISITFSNKKYVCICANTILRYYLSVFIARRVNYTKGKDFSVSTV